MRVLLFSGSLSKLADDMSILALASQDVLVRHQSVKSDGSTCVDAPGADPDLGTETISKAVGEARTRVDEHARRVDATDKGAARVCRLGDDAISMVRAMLVDVGYGGSQGGHGAHG